MWFIMEMSGGGSAIEVAHFTSDRGLNHVQIIQSKSHFVNRYRLSMKKR